MEPVAAIARGVPGNASTAFTTGGGLGKSGRIALNTYSAIKIAGTEVNYTFNGIIRDRADPRPEFFIVHSVNLDRSSLESIMTAAGQVYREDELDAALERWRQIASLARAALKPRGL